MEERKDLQSVPPPPEAIRQGFSNQLKKLTLLNESSPRIFMMHVHSLYGKVDEEDRATFNIVKQIQGYLCPTIQACCSSRKGHLKLNLYSDLALRGNCTDPYDEYGEAEVLYSQMCLLPKHDRSVDYVILCGSHPLQEYTEIKEVSEYINYLRTILSKELSKAKPNFNNLYAKAGGALDILKERWKVKSQELHRIYTELAFLQLRLEEQLKDIRPPSNLITMIIDRNPDTTSSSSISSDIQGNSIYLRTTVGMDKNPQAFYVGIFQLLRRLFSKTGLDACRRAIDNAHSTFIANTHPALWTAEYAREFAKQHKAHQAGKIARQQARARSSFFALSTSSEEDAVTEEELILTGQLSCETTVPLEPSPYLIEQGKPFCLTESKKYFTETDQGFIRKKQPTKLLPRGAFSFLDIEKADECYIDKTHFIEALLKDGSKVKLITRPSRFGKSLALSTLEYFLDAEKNREMETSLGRTPFEGYLISEKKELTESHQGKYTVIFLNFLDLAEGSYKEFIRALKNMLHELYSRFLYVKNEKNESNFKRIMDGKLHDTVALSSALNQLCNYIFEYNKSTYSNEKEHHHKPLILIDEFDAPLLKASIGGFFPEVLSFIQRFLLRTLKSKEQSYSMAVLSGIIRVAGSKLLSTLNNISTYSSMKEDTFSHCFGFIEADVKNILRLRGLNIDTEYPNLLEHYGYYFCGNQLLFNPWSIAHAIMENKIDYQNHWIKSQRDTFIKTAMESLSEQLKNILKQLLKEPYFISTVVTDHVSCISPLQELTILPWEQKESQKTNYALLRDKNGSWHYRYMDATKENTFHTETVDAKNNSSLFSLVKSKQEVDIEKMKEEREFKEHILRIIVQEKSIIRLDEKVWLLSLLYSAGFLTGIPFTKENKKLNEFELALMIPNKEIFDFYIQEMGLRKLDYPYEKRSEVIKRISSSYFTKDKVKELLDGFAAKNADANFTLFYICSLLSNIAIPRNFLESLMNSSDVANFISLLEKYSFIDKWDLTKNSIDMNQSVHTQVFHYFHEGKQKHEELNQEVIQLVQRLEQFFTERNIEAYSSTFIDQQTIYYKHVERIVVQFSKGLLKTNRMILLYRLAYYELYIGMHFHLSVQHFTSYIDSSEEGDTLNRLLIANAYHGLGLAYYRLGQFSDAEVALNKAVMQCESLLEETSANKEITELLGDIHTSQGRLFIAMIDIKKNKMALSYFEKAEILHSEIEAKKICLSSQILLLKLQTGTISIQEILSEMQQLEKVLVHAKPSLLVANTQLNLAKFYVYLETESYEKQAHQLLNTAEETVSHIFGSKHFELLPVLTQQLRIYRKYTDYQERYDRASTILKNCSLEVSNFSYALLNFNMGLIYHEESQPYQALKYHQDAALFYNSRSSIAYPMLAAVKNLVGEASRLVGKISDAEKAYKESYEITQALYGENHINALINLNNLGEIDLSRGHIQEAEHKFHTAYDGIKKHLGESHIKTLILHCNLVKCRFLQGDYSELYGTSDSVFESINKTQEQGYNRLLVSEVFYHYGKMYSSMKHLDLAKVFLEAARDLLEKPTYKRYPLYALVASELMVLYGQYSQFEKGLHCMKVAKDIFEKFAWVNFPSYIGFLLHATKFLYLIEQSDTAELLSQKFKKILNIADPISFLLKEVLSKYQKHDTTAYVLEKLDTHLFLSQLRMSRKEFLQARDLLEPLHAENWLSKSHFQAEMYYRLACVYKNWAQDKNKEEKGVYLEKAKDFFIRYQTFPRVIYSDTVIDITHKLKANNLLGRVSIQKFEDHIMQWQSFANANSIPLLEQDKIIALTNYYQARYEKNCLAGHNVTNVLTTLVVLSYVMNDISSTQRYLSAYKALGKAGFLILDVVILAGSISTDIQQLHEAMKEVLDELSDSDAYEKEAKAIICHNLACFYHAQVYQQQLLWGTGWKELHKWGVIEELFLKAIALADLVTAKGEYINFLYRQGKGKMIHELMYDPAYTILEEYTSHTYSVVEKPLLVDPLQQVLSVERYITVNAKALLYYLFLLNLWSISEDASLYEKKVESYFSDFKELMHNQNTQQSAPITSYLLADIAFHYYNKTHKEEYAILAKEQIEHTITFYCRDNVTKKECVYATSLQEKLTEAASATANPSISAKRLCNSASTHSWLTFPTENKKNIYTLITYSMEFDVDASILKNQLYIVFALTHLMEFNWEVCLDENTILVALRAKHSWDILVRPSLLIELRTLLAALEFEKTSIKHILAIKWEDNAIYIQTVSEETARRLGHVIYAILHTPLSKETVIEQRISPHHLIEHMVTSTATNANVLDLCVLLYREAIPYDLLQTVLEKQDIISNFLCDLGKHHASATLCRIDSHHNLFLDGILHNHLVEHCTRDTLHPYILPLLSYFSDCKGLVLNEYESETYSACRNSFSHVEHLLSMMKMLKIDFVSPLQYELQYLLGRYYLYVRDDAQKAMDVWKPLLEIDAEILPPHINRASIFSYVGKAYYYQNAFSKALTCFEEADKRFLAQTTKANHKKMQLSRARNWVRWATLYTVQSEYSKALVYFQKAFDVYHAESTPLYQALALLTEAQALEIRFGLDEISDKEALELCKQNLTVCCQLLPEHSVIVARLKIIYIHLLYKTRALEAKIISYEDMLTLSQGILMDLIKWYGEYHLKVAKLLIHQLAIRGYTDYESHCNRIEFLLDKTFNRAKHYLHAYFYLVRGEVAYEEGALHRALAYLYKAEKIYQKLFPHSHRDLLHAYELMGDICRREGDLQNAETYFTLGYSLAQQLLEKNDGNIHSIALFANKLGEIALQCDAFQEARDYFEKARETIEESCQAHSPILLYAVHINLIKLQFYQGNYTDLQGNPELHYRQLKECRDKQPQYLKTLANIAYGIAEVYATSGHIEHGLWFLQYAEEWMREFLVAKHIISSGISYPIEHPFLARIYVHKGIMQAMVQGNSYQKIILDVMRKAEESLLHYDWSTTPVYGRCLANQASIERRLGLPARIDVLQRAKDIFDRFQKGYLLESSVVKLLLGIEYGNQGDYARGFTILEEAILILEKRNDALPLVKEFYFYLAKMAFNLGHYARARQYFIKLEKSKLDNKEDLLAQLMGWLDINGLLGFAAWSHIQEILEEKNLQDKLTLETFRQSFSLPEKEKILVVYETTLHSLEQKTLLPNTQVQVLSVVVLVAYCLGEVEKARAYFEKLKSAVGNKEIEVFLQPFSLATFISSHPQAMIDKIETLLETSQREQRAIEDVSLRSLYHSLMVLYHLNVCRMQFFGLPCQEQEKKIDVCFEKCQTLLQNKTMLHPTLVEYCLILLHHGRKNALSALLKNYASVLSSATLSDVQLLYGAIQRPYLPLLLQKVMGQEKRLAIHSGPLFAYIAGLCYKEENGCPIETIIQYLQNAAEHFSQSIYYHLFIHIVVLHRKEEAAKEYIEKLKKIEKKVEAVFPDGLASYQQLCQSTPLLLSKGSTSLKRKRSTDNLLKILEVTHPTAVNFAEATRLEKTKDSLYAALRTSLLLCFPWQVTLMSSKQAIEISLRDEAAIYCNIHLLSNLLVDLSVVLSNQLAFLHVCYEIRNGYLILEMKTPSAFETVKSILGCLESTVSLNSLITQQQLHGAELPDVILDLYTTISTEDKATVEEKLNKEKRSLLKKRNVVDELIDYALIQEPHAALSERALDFLKNRSSTFYQSFLINAYQGDLQCEHYVSSAIKHTKTISGMSVLHLAALGRHPALVRQLCDYLPPDVQDNEGRTPAYLARLRGHVDIAIMLEKEAEERELQNFDAVGFIKLQGMDALLEAFSSEKSYCEYILMGASATGKKTTTHFLISHYIKKIRKTDIPSFIFECQAHSWYSLAKSQEVLAERLGIVVGEVYEKLEVGELKESDTVVKKRVALLQERIQQVLQEKYANNWLIVYKHVPNEDVYSAIQSKEASNMYGRVIITSSNPVFLGSHLLSSSSITCDLNNGVSVEEINQKFATVLGTAPNYQPALISLFKEGTSAFALKIALKTFALKEIAAQDFIVVNQRYLAEHGCSWEDHFYSLLQFCCVQFIKNAGEMAESLLQILGFFAEHGVPIDFLDGYFKQKSKITLEENLQQLVQYGLVDYAEKEDLFRLHHFVRVFLRKSYPLDKDCLERLLVAMHRYFVTLVRDTQEAFHEARVFHHHIRHCLDLILTPSLSRDVDAVLVAQLCQDLGDYCRHIAHYKHALRYYQKAKEQLETTEEATDTVRYLIAEVYYRQGKYPEAEQELESLIDKLHALVNIDLQLAKYRHLLGLVYLRQGNYQSAMQQHQEAFSLRQQSMDNHAPILIAQSYDALGEVYYFQGDYVKAQDSLKKALPIFEKRLGKHHRSTMVCYTKLGLALQKQGFFDEALGWYHQAFTIAAQLFSSNHQEVAYICYARGLLHVEREEWKEALYYFHRSFAINVHLLGMSHIHTATLYYHIADIYLKQAQYQEGERLFQKTIALFSQLLGEDSIHVGRSWLGLGETYLVYGSFEKAKEALLHSEHIYKAAVDKRNMSTFSPEILRCKRSFAMYYVAQGEYRKALSYYRSGLQMLDQNKQQTQEHALLYNGMAQVYCKMERYDEASKVLEQVSASCHHQGWTNTLIFANYLHYVGHIHYKQENYKAASDNLSKSLAIKKKILPENHADFTEIYVDLINIAINSGKLEEATEYHDRALAVLQNIFNKDHPKIIDFYNQLGELAYGQEKYAMALLYFEQSLQRQKNDPKHLFNVGKTKHALGCKEEAMEDYQSCLAHFDSISRKNYAIVIDCRIQLGSLYAEKKEYDKAHGEYYQVLNVYKKHRTPAQTLLLYLQQGEVYEKQEIYNEAMQAFNSAKQVIAGKKDSKNKIKKVLIALRIARVKFTQASKKNTSNRLFYQNLQGEILTHIIAIKQIYGAAYEKYPLIIEAYRLLAQIKEKLHVYDEACSYYEKVLHYYESGTRVSSHQSECIEFSRKIARIYYENVKTPEKALHYYLKAHDLQEKISNRTEENPSVKEALRKLESDFTQKAEAYKGKGVQVLQFQFYALMKAYRIQRILDGEDSELASGTKTKLEILAAHIKKLPLLKRLESVLQSSFKTASIFYVKEQDWKKMQEKPILMAGSRNGFSEAGLYHIVDEIQNMQSGKTLCLLTELSVPGELTVTAIRCLKEPTIRYQAIHIDVSLHSSLFIHQVKGFFYSLAISLELCSMDYFYAQLDIDFANNVLAVLYQLEDARFQAEPLWENLLERITVDNVQNQFSAAARKVEMLHMLSAVKINDVGQYRARECSVSNFFCRSLALVTPTLALDALFTGHDTIAPLSLVIYGDLHAAHLELARQICHVRLYGLPPKALKKRNHIQWLLNCEYEHVLRGSLENFLFSLQEKVEHFDVELMDTKSLISYVFQKIASSITRTNVARSHGSRHISIIFNNIPNADWINQMIQSSALLPTKAVQCTLLFLMDAKTFKERGYQEEDCFKSLTYPPLDATKCMNVTKQERLTASKVNIRRLTPSQCDILSRLVLFAAKPLREEEYHLLIGLIAPDVEPKKVWLELKNALMEQSWLEYDDVKEKATCHYYIAEAVRNQLLQAYFYRNTEKKYTLPNTPVRIDSSKPRQDYARLKGFLHLLIKQIGFAKELLSGRQFTQAGRFTFVYTFIEAFQQIMPLSVVSSLINEASLHEALEALLTAVYKEQLDCALMIHDFPTIHQVIEQRFAQDSSCRFKQAWALIKMGHLTINKEKIDDLIHQEQPLQETEPLLFLERLVVIGIRYWYESNIPELQSVLKTIKIFINQKPILSEKDQLLWDLLQSEIWLLQLRSYRFFIDNVKEEEAMVDRDKEAQKLRYYQEGNTCYQKLKQFHHAHHLFQRPEIYLEGALLANAQGKWEVYMSRLLKANTAVEEMDFAAYSPTCVEIFKQLSLEYCRKGNMKEAYHYCTKAIEVVKVTFNEYQPDKLKELFDLEDKHSPATKWLLAQCTLESSPSIVNFTNLQEVEKMDFLLEVFRVAFNIYLRGFYGEKTPNVVRAKQDLQHISESQSVSSNRSEIAKLNPATATNIVTDLITNVKHDNNMPSDGLQSPSGKDGDIEKSMIEPEIVTKSASLPNTIATNVSTELEDKDIYLTQELVNRGAQQNQMNAVIETVEKSGNDSIEIPSEGKKSCTQDVPCVQACEDFKKTVTGFITPRQKSKRFSFILRKVQEENGFHIQLANKNKIGLGDKAIRDNLVALKDALEENLEQMELLDGEHYDMEFDADAGTLIITSNEMKTLNTIGAILEDAGQSYWNADQLSRSNIFFFNSSQEASTESSSIQVIDEITCAVQ